MRWLLYHILFAIGYTLMLPRFIARMRRRGGYGPHFRHRFGRYEPELRRRLSEASRVWIHAVSVGEVYVAGQVMSAMRRLHPGIGFVLSTTSSTGWREAEKQVGPQDVLIYNPLDFPGCVRRALDAIRPRAFILTESEFWPTLLRACGRRGIPAVLVNGRVSDRSAPGYRRLRWWFGPVLRTFRLLQVQSELDRQRLVDAGADPASVEVTGSFKVDVARRDPVRERDLAAVLQRVGMAGGSLLVGGSTWPGEEQVLLEVYQQLRPRHPQLRLALVPRHFERGPEVAERISSCRLVPVRKSRLDRGDAPPATGAEAVLLVDTTGDLGGLYPHAAIVFVGKSLFELGGQNMIEPCMCGAATLVGPHTENFRPVMSDLLAARAIVQVTGPEALAAEIARLLDEPSAAAALGERAAAAVAARRGVVDASARRVLSLIGLNVGTQSAKV